MLALVTAAAYTVVFAVAGVLIIDLFTDIASVREAAYRYLPWMIVAPLVSVWSFQLDGIFIGTTRTVEMRNAMLLSVAVYVIAVWVLVPLWANHGLWLSLMLFMAMRALTLGVLLRRVDASLA